MSTVIRPADNRILVFIPSFGDGRSASLVADEVRQALPEAVVLIIDDGSPEGDIAEEGHGAHLLLRLVDNFGLGVCTHVAIDHMLRHGYDILVRIDADGQHPGEEIASLCRPIVEGRADVVVGSRLNHDEEGSLLRTLVKRYYNLVASAATGGRAPKDVNSGFFALNREAGRKINGRLLERFPEPQMFILACRLGLRMAEVGISQRERESGRSTLNLLHAARMFYRFNMFVLNELMRGAGR